MGLDITAYRKLEEVRPRGQDEDGYDEGLAYFYAEPAFPGRFEGLKEGVLYRAAEEFGFRAGSYGGYNNWREWLAKVAGYPLTEYRDAYRGVRQLHAAACWQGAQGPFSELIDFSDAEGTIGPGVAAKLAKDFAEWEERAKAADDSSDGWYFEVYKEWRKAMEMAADGGAVAFH